MLEVLVDYDQVLFQLVELLVRCVGRSAFGTLLEAIKRRFLDAGLGLLEGQLLHLVEQVLIHCGGFALCRKGGWAFVVVVEVKKRGVTETEIEGKRVNVYTDAWRTPPRA